MAQIHCNFFSYSLCHGVDIEVTLPSFTSCNMDDPHTHSLSGKFPVVYLLHGMGNDYMAWLRYTSVERYAEEKRIAIVTFSVGNKAYMNDDMGDNYYDFLNHELPEFVEAYFAILRAFPWVATARCCTALRIRTGTARLVHYLRPYSRKRIWKAKRRRGRSG